MNLRSLWHRIPGQAPEIELRSISAFRFRKEEESEQGLKLGGRKERFVPSVWVLNEAERLPGRLICPHRPTIRLREKKNSE